MPPEIHLISAPCFSDAVEQVRLPFDQVTTGVLFADGPFQQEFLEGGYAAARHRAQSQDQRFLGGASAVGA